MQLEDYFNFLADDDIRLKGTRVGIETILYDYIHKEKSPEEIANTYTLLTLEQVRNHSLLPAQQRSCHKVSDRLDRVGKGDAEDSGERPYMAEIKQN